MSQGRAGHASAIEGHVYDVRDAIAQGRYDAALDLSTEMACLLGVAGVDDDLAGVAAEAWALHGEALELNDRLHDALRARERGILVERRGRRAPSRLAVALAQAGQTLRLLDRSEEATALLASAKEALADAGREGDGRGALRAGCVVASLEADLRCDAEDYETATALKARVLAGWREVYPEAEYPDGHAELANAITDCGWVAGEMNDDAAMARLYEEALAARERLHPSGSHPLGHPDLASAYNNVAFARMQLGLYVDAEVFYAKAVRMRERLFPPDRFPDGRAEMAVSHMNLGELLMRRGDLLHAQGQYAKALAIRERAYPQHAYPEGHSDLLRTLMSLGKVRLERDGAASAIPVYERACGMARSLYPEAGDRSGHALLAWVLHDYGRALMLAGRDEAALEVLGQAEKVYALGSTPNFLHASTLAGLGELHARWGRAGACADCCERARSMYEAAYPASTYEAGHLNLATGLARLARVALLVGDGEAARRLAARSQASYRALADRFVLDSALFEGLLLRAQFAHLPALILSVDAGGDGTEGHALVFETKGAARRVQALRAEHLRKVGDPGVGQARLRELRAELSRLLFLPFDRRYAARRREAFQDLSDEKQLLEQRIARAVRPELEASARLAASAVRFRQRMPADAAFIDVIRCARTSVSTCGARAELVERDEYTAFVLDGSGTVARVDLGAADVIDDLVERWRADIERGDDAPTRSAASRRVWDPIKAVLRADRAKVLLSPDGALHRLPWLALDDELGRPVLETRRLALMSDAWIASADEDPSPGKAATLVVGDVAYGSGPGRMLRRRPSWSGLAHGRRELEGVVDASDAPTVLARERATAGALLAAVGGKSVVHVATHGFYVGPSTKEGFDLDPELVDPLSDAGERERRSARRHSPLLSGLVLAGANDWPDLDAEGLPTGGRTVVTAEEIAGADAGHAALVVLSACETNLGDVIGGEGVLGLRAAFHEAGARCVISSLWPVEDHATCELMTELHRNLATRAMGAPEALRRAQLAALSRRGDVGRGTRDWAGFVPSVSSWGSFDPPPAPLG